VRLPATLHRQQLIRLSGDGWARVLEAPWDATARSCLGLWASRGLPLVVTRQPPGSADSVATGLPAPARYQRRRLAVAVAPQDVLFLDAFPPGDADAVTRLLPRTSAGAWRALLGRLVAVDCAPRVYGGYGWQALTRLAYVHAESDIDLLLPVSSAVHADAVTHLLAFAAGGAMGVGSCRVPASAGQEGRLGPDPGWSGPRLDGELVFPDGGAIAWREWLAHRAGHAPQALVKRLRGVALETP
jgi:phosphoribosyl-dephospho-CoA transferase